MRKSLKVMTVLTLASLTANFTTISTSAVESNPSYMTMWVARAIDEIKASLLSQQVERGQERQVYVIQWGDTLANIAFALGVDVDTLAAVNAIQNPDLIMAGSILYLDGQNHTITYSDAAGNHIETISTETKQAVAPVKPTDAVYHVAAAQADGYIQEETYETIVAATTTEAAPIETTTVVLPETTSSSIPLTSEAATTLAEPETTTVAPETTSESVSTLDATTTETTTTTTEVVPVTTTVLPETTTAAPTTSVETTTLAPETTTAAASSGYNAYGGIYSEAKEWIAMKESGGSYDAVNPTGKYIGRYQLTNTYLNGDYSPENQERVADQYVLNRYGSWEAAKAFWLANGWY